MKKYVVIKPEDIVCIGVVTLFLLAACVRRRVRLARLQSKRKGDMRMKVQPPIFLVEDRMSYTESELRQAEIDQHVAAFLRKGGKVQELAMDVSGYDRSGKLAQPFVINNHVLPRKKAKQYWMEQGPWKNK